MGYKKFQVYFFVAVLAGSFILTLVVFRPYLAILAFGGVFAVVARPLYLLILKWLKSETAAAFLTIVIIASLVILPSVFFFAALTAELGELFSNISGYFDNNTFSQVLLRMVPAQFHGQIPAMIEEGTRLIRSFAELLSRNLLDFFSNLFGIVFGFLVVLFSTYYLLKDGTKVKKEMLALSPLGDDHDEEVFQRVIVTVRAVMTGILIVGLIKGVLSGIFYWIFGIPAPLFWGTMTGFASFIPIMGSALVTVPAIIYLLLIGKVGAAIGLSIVSFAIIGTIDNFLQPKLVESKTNIHPLLILLSILGGLQFYGFAGFILGPLTLSVTMALIDIYKKEFRGYLEKVPG
ncbi:MAG TPA: AI-2E family transporter [Candidatus Eisenbacteria bacterium]|jgi:predicted PurR-regulated permease PerM|nr:AI-2E family transporter [Candidatus Eisenbacteria bacterium]